MVHESHFQKHCPMNLCFSLVSRHLYFCGICLKANVLQYVIGENIQNKLIQIQLLSAQQYPDKTHLP